MCHNHSSTPPPHPSSRKHRASPSTLHILTDYPIIILKVAARTIIITDPSLFPRPWSLFLQRADGPGRGALHRILTIPARVRVQRMTKMFAARAAVVWLEGQVFQKDCGSNEWGRTNRGEWGYTNLCCMHGIERSNVSRDRMVFKGRVSLYTRPYGQRRSLCVFLLIALILIIFPNNPLHDQIPTASYPLPQRSTFVQAKDLARHW